MTHSPVPFAVVGAGWRAAFHLRAAAALPDRLRVTGVMSRDAGKVAALDGGANLPVHAGLDALLAARPRFVVVATPWAVTPALVRELAGRGMPVLAETPPAPDLDGLASMVDLATRPPVPIEVAEQYHLQPLHAARLAVVASGLLGTVTQAQVSAAHDYHGIDLLRRYLGVGFGTVRIRARRFASPIVAGPDRAGPPVDERIDTSSNSSPGSTSTAASASTTSRTTSTSPGSARRACWSVASAARSTGRPCGGCSTHGPRWPRS